jgi:small-conductance mechanosensitive channel
MDKQQEINFSMMHEFRERDISFAFPSRTLYLSPSNLRQIGFDSLRAADQTSQAGEA